MRFGAVAPLVEVAFVVFDDLAVRAALFDLVPMAAFVVLALAVLDEVGREVLAEVATSSGALPAAITAWAAASRATGTRKGEQLT